MFLKELEKLDNDNNSNSPDTQQEDQANNTYGANKLNSIFSKIQKQQQQTDKKITDFEKNLGLRLQKLNEKDNECEDPQQDAEHFEKEIQSQYGNIKKNFRDVVDGIRTKEYQQFVRINSAKARLNENNGAYNKLE